MIHRHWSRPAKPESTGESPSPEGFRPTLSADVRLPEGTTPDSAVVIVHGFKGFKDWGFFPHLAESLVADGHAAISLNFSLNGIGSDPLEFTELEAFARNTLTRELDELHQTIDALADSDILQVPPRRIGLFGHSRGGGTAILAAFESDRVHALVTWAAVADFDRWDSDTKKMWRRDGRIHVLNGRTGQQMPLDIGLLDDFERNRQRLDIAGAARKVDVPWLIIHGTDDPAVSINDARTLADAQPDARLVEVEQAGHTFEVGHPFEGPSPTYELVLERTREHFRRALLDADPPELEPKR